MLARGLFGGFGAGWQHRQKMGEDEGGGEETRHGRFDGSIEKNKNGEKAFYSPQEVTRRMDLGEDGCSKKKT